MQTHYEYHLRCGSGWIKAIVSFLTDALVSVYYDIRWMGIDELIRYRLLWRHKAITGSHGLLSLESVEKYDSYTGDSVSPVNLDGLLKVDGDDETYRQVQREVTFEYLLMPHTFHIAEDPGFEELRQIGAAHWHQEFDLLLLLNFSMAEAKGHLKGTVFGGILHRLDKMKFTAVSEPIFGYDGDLSLGRQASDVIDEELPF